MKIPTKHISPSDDRLNTHSTLAEQASHSPKLPALLLSLSLVSIVLLVLVGGALFFFPAFSQSRWLWPLAPYNTRFLGAIYLTALVSLTSMVLGRHAGVARLVVPMMWIFTTVVLLVSCVQLEQFAVARKATDIWFWLYLIDCIGASYYLAYFRQQSFVGLSRLPRLWSVGLGIQAGLLGAYGLGLLIYPETTSSTWSWPLDIFHARLYSSIFLTGAVGSAMLSRWATAAECRALGAVQLAFSALVLAGVWVVDRAAGKIDWSLWGNWVWIGAIALLGAVGISLLSLSWKTSWRKR